MTREQLLALGYTEEQVNQIIALYGQATQTLRATVGQHEETIKTLNGQLTQLQNQQMSVVLRMVDDILSGGYQLVDLLYAQVKDTQQTGNSVFVNHAFAPFTAR